MSSKRIRSRTQDQGQRRRNSPERQEIVVIRVQISGTTWTVEANDRSVTNVLSGSFTPQPGEVFEARHIGRAWQLNRRVPVTRLPSEISHPRYPELSATTQNIIGPSILRVGEETLIPDHIDPASLVQAWRVFDIARV